MGGSKTLFKGAARPSRVWVEKNKKRRPKVARKERRDKFDTPYILLSQRKRFFFRLRSSKFVTNVWYTNTIPLSLFFLDRSFLAVNALADRNTIFCSEDFVAMFGYSKAEVFAKNKGANLEFLQVRKEGSVCTTILRD